MRTAPAKLDTSTTIQLKARSRSVMRRAARPMSMHMALPVKSSPPNRLMKQMPTGNRMPVVSLGSMGQAVRVATGMPPDTVTTRMTPSPSHHPARQPRKKRRGNGRCALMMESFSCCFSTSCNEFISTGIWNRSISRTCSIFLDFVSVAWDALDSEWVCPVGLSSGRTWAHPRGKTNSAAVLSFMAGWARRLAIGFESFISTLGEYLFQCRDPRVEGVENVYETTF